MPTCQICAREIKAKNGLIAHHGYQRPYQSHYQTSSCFGARHVPYEIGHDAIDAYLALLAGWITDTEAKIAKMVSEPPDKLTYIIRNAWHKIVEQKDYDKPADFDPNGFKNGMRSYITLWHSEHRELQQRLSGLKNDQKFLTKRRQEWRAAQ